MSEKVPDFWMQPTFPQYRKIVDGEEKCLDGTETDDTEIVKYDYTDEYKEAMRATMKPLEDTDPMPFGAHKGRPMQYVPASYFHWLWTQEKNRDWRIRNNPVFDYINRNIVALKKEHPDGLWT